MTCQRVTFVHPETKLTLALALLPEGELSFVEEDPFDLRQQFNIEVDGSLCPYGVPTFSKTRRDLLTFLLNQHGVTNITTCDFNYVPSPGVATVTITNHTTAEITLYRLQNDGCGVLIGLVPAGFTVSMSPFVLRTKLRAMNITGQSWDFVVDENNEKWTLTPTGWSGSVGLPHSIVGKWVGYYPGHGEEIIEVTLQGNQFVATKVTGDNNVPAGQITWRVNIGNDIHVLQGEGQIANAGFCSPSFVTGILNIISEGQIVFSWGLIGSVSYRRHVENTICQPQPVQPIVCPTPPPVQTKWGQNLVGQWVGFYPGCGDEIIQLNFQGEQLVATKVTGDNYIPAGQVTWKVHMTSPTAGTGQGQVAYAGFRSPYWKNGDLKVINENQISFGSFQWPTITYRRKF
jgi:hypothetical protein